MDGINTSRTTPLRLRARTIIVLAITALGWGATPALADPAIDFAPGSALTQQAVDVAHAVWGTDPCAGAVTIGWTALDPSVNASSTWSNPLGAYDAPARNSDCSIAFNSALAWDWIRYCSVLVHEYGHLTGHPHDPDPAAIMNAYYTRPADQCVAAAPAAPVETAPALTALPAPAQSPVAFSAQKVRRAHHERVGMIVAIVTDHAKRHAHRHHRHAHRHSHRWYLLQQYHQRHHHRP